MTDALPRALAAGATVVTPNRRLARHLVDEHDRAQRAAGRLAWVSAKALPWSAFLAELETEATAAGALEPRVRLGELGSAELWRGTVEADGPAALDAGALARAAAEAWDLVHAYGSGVESWRAWAGGQDEPAAFARWAERYRNALDARRASDAATAADRVAKADPARVPWRGRRVVFAGFLELTPQQRRLAEALRRAGATVDELATLGDAVAPPLRGAFASPDAELCAALAWARHGVERRPEARIGIVVPDLAQRRPIVRLRAIDLLGLPAEGDPGAPSWNLSLGAPIAEVPLVAAALDLIALAWTALPAGRAAALLRAAHLPGAFGEARRHRGAVERAWLEDTLVTVRIEDAIGELGRRNDPLAVRLAAVHDVARRVARTTRRGWVDAWRDALAKAGWPGERALGSAEHQAARALDEHFVAFAALDAIASGPRGAAELGAEAAIAAFADVLADSPFQPEMPPAPVQILGLYEAIGLPFDALWVAGMNDETLPRAPRPHPFLPVGWQRDRGVPRSDAAHELAFAREAASWLLRAAPVVVVSHATAVDDRPSLPSSVFAAGPQVDVATPARPAQAMFASRPRLDRLVDATAPPLAAVERATRGYGSIAAQSDCPFQALAGRRWRADPWPETTVGLTPIERGNLVHEALASFWRATGTHDALVALSFAMERFADACRRAADAAIATIDASRWRRIPAAVRAQEAERLVRVLREWLVIEAGREPFEVAGIEHDATLSLPPLELALRLDRVDRFTEGGVAILDYKTGGAARPARWTNARPEAVQMALYTLAWRDAHPGETVRATALALVKRGETKAIGLYADEGARLGPPPEREDDSIVDPAALEERWRELMQGLAADYAGGVAGVSPREAKVCRYCARQALCRVDSVVADEDDEGDEAGA